MFFNIHLFYLFFLHLAYEKPLEEKDNCTFKAKPPPGGGPLPELWNLAQLR